MNPQTFQQLHREGLISDESLRKVEAAEKTRLFSVHWELKTLLYLGITLVSVALGILVYQNIDTIGHQAILAFVALVSAGCFYYCRRKSAPFSVHKVLSPGPFFDYILLLGCLTMITFIAYIQFTYSVFGNRYGLATCIPMVILFFCAYYFDHLGVLWMAITNLAAWAGIAITPAKILKENDFDDLRLIATGICFGILLQAAAATSENRNIKKHFAFTFRNFGTHILFISALAGLFTQSYFLVWILILLLIALYTYRQARLEHSFYFLLVVILYSYIALGYMVVSLLGKMQNDEMTALFLGLLYFILSAIALVRLLIVTNRKMKAHDRL